MDQQKLEQLPGTEYARYALPLEYPPSRDFCPRWGYRRSPIPELHSWFSEYESEYRQFLAEMRHFGRELRDLPKDFDAANLPMPAWSGIPIAPLDTLALYTFVRVHQPSTFLEIGSGATTCFAHLARQRGNAETRIISIDPEPRAAIDAICDEVIRAGLETCDLSVFEKLVPGDIVFMDGSHRSFMNSDVTVFFIDVLPRLKPGVIVHIHDISLPYDYSSYFANWYWNEQYLLAVYLMGNRARITPLLPTAFVGHEAMFSLDIAMPFVDTPFSLDWRGGGSMWFTHSSPSTSRLTGSADSDSSPLSRSRASYTPTARPLYQPWAMPLPLPHANFISTFATDSVWGSKVATALTSIEIEYATHLLDELDRARVQGAIIEFGVFDGTWLSHLAQQRERAGSSRPVWGFDSFEGLPPVTEHDLSCWSEGMYAADYNEVRARLNAGNRPWLTLKKGWFSETLSHSDVQAIEEIAFARIDCDLYAPAVECLNFLTSRIVIGSVIVFDDWTYDPGKGETKAAMEWLSRNPKISLELLAAHGLGHLYFRVTAI